MRGCFGVTAAAENARPAPAHVPLERKLVIPLLELPTFPGKLARREEEDGPHRVRVGLALEEGGREKNSAENGGERTCGDDGALVLAKDKTKASARAARRGTYALGSEDGALAVAQHPRQQLLVVAQRGPERRVQRRGLEELWHAVVELLQHLQVQLQACRLQVLKGGGVERP